MQKRRSLISIFIIFAVLSGIIVILFQQPIFAGIRGSFELITTPLQRMFYGIAVKNNDTPLQQENMILHKQLVNKVLLEEDNKALRNQFEEVAVSSKSLLPGYIIGTRGFVPGVSQPHTIVIDKGQSEGVTIGDAVIVENNLVGIVTRVSSHIASIELITSEKTSFTARTLKTNALGIVRGQKGEGILLEDVLLSEKLEKGDTVITKGDVSDQGNGIPPDLVIGEITSVNKKSSDLFQSAELKGLIDITKIRLVFVLTE